MRAEQVIVTHGNTDFDALRGDARRAEALPGRGRLPLGLAEPQRARVPPPARRGAADRRGVAARARRDPAADRGRDRCTPPGSASSSASRSTRPWRRSSSTTTRATLPDWVAPENAVLSEDGALTTTLVGHPRRARASRSRRSRRPLFALGIHEDTGSLSYPTATAARRRGARLVPAPRRAAGPLVDAFLHTPLAADGARAAARAARVARAACRSAASSCSSPPSQWPQLRGRRLEPRAQARRPHRRARLVAARRDGRAASSASRAAASPELDAAALAAALGGGGHEQAASAIFRGALDRGARALLDGALPDGACASRCARATIMSRPRARRRARTSRSRRRWSLCQRHGQSGCSSSRASALVGVVGREDLDQAIVHGLAHAPVKGIMSARVATARRGHAARRAAAPARGRRPAAASPSSRDERVVGVVTRSDVLRALGEAAGEPPEPEARPRRRARRARAAAARVPGVAAVAGPYEGVYLVGGTVRDILLGERELRRRHRGRGRRHRVRPRARGRARRPRRARTRSSARRSSLYGDGERIDVVTARTEFYEAPAALPTVEHATIREDLFRRDFTINAMAVSLKGEDFGRLVDPFGGRRDLEAGTIRVLHNLSFIDDPTRIFRAIRYENRYGFRMDEHTARLARGCIEMGLVGDLSSARLRDELVALLEERRASSTRSCGSASSARRARSTRTSPPTRRRPRCSRGSRELRDELRARRARLAARARRARAAALAGRGLRLARPAQGPPPRRRARSPRAVTVGPRLVERLRAEHLAPADVVALAEPLRARRAAVRARARRAASRCAPTSRRLRRVRLEVTGADLAELGLGESPRVGEILAELRRRKLNGELDGRESELAAARELIELLELIRWDAPGPYERRLHDARGGVSEGPYDVAQPRPAHRRRAAARRGEPAPRSRPRRAPTPSGSPGRARCTAPRSSAPTGRAATEADALWTDEPGVGLVVAHRGLPADRARARRRRRPALALVHAGWRGLADGVVEAGVRSARRRRSPPWSAPASARAATRSAPRWRERFGDAYGRRRSTCARSAERALRRAGRRGRRPRRPLHGLRRRAVLLAPPRPRAHRPAGSACPRRLTRSASATSACAPRSART